MKTWIRHILFVCLIGFAAYLQTNSYFQSEPSTSQTESNIIDIQEDLAHRLHQQYEWSDALASIQISARNSENRLRTRRTHSFTSFGARILSKYNHPYAILFRIEGQTAHQLNHISAFTHWLELSLSREQISYPFHCFW